MQLLIFLFKSGMNIKEVLKTSEIRAKDYRKVRGLLQKFYVRDRSSNHFGGIFIFDSKENLKAFRNSELVRSSQEAYKFLDPPDIRELEIVKLLHEQKEHLI